MLHNCNILMLCNDVIETSIAASHCFNTFLINADQQNVQNTQDDKPCKLPAFLVNIHLCTFEFIQLSPNHSLTQAKAKQMMTKVPFTGTIQYKFFQSVSFNSQLSAVSYCCEPTKVVGVINSSGVARLVLCGAMYSTLCCSTVCR